VADPAKLALIHAEIDGELDAAGRGELARWVLADPAGRQLRDELTRLCAALDSLPAVEPPPELRASILAALPQSYLRRPRSWMPGWRYAALAASLIVAGIVVLQVVREPGAAPSEVVGTMTAAGATVLDTVQLTNAPLSGRVSLYRDPSGLGLTFDLVATSPVTVLVTGGGHTLRINGVAATEKPGATTRVALPGFPADVQTLDLAFQVGGSQVGTATLHTAPGR
jgi:anti-sigma factor RsiW